MADALLFGAPVGVACLLLPVTFEPCCSMGTYTAGTAEAAGAGPSSRAGAATALGTTDVTGATLAAGTQATAEGLTGCAGAASESAPDFGALENAK